MKSLLTILAIFIFSCNVTKRISKNMPVFGTNLYEEVLDDSTLISRMVDSLRQQNDDRYMVLIDDVSDGSLKIVFSEVYINSSMPYKTVPRLYRLGYEEKDENIKKLIIPHKCTQGEWEKSWRFKLIDGKAVIVTCHDTTYLEDISQ